MRFLKRMSFGKIQKRVFNPLVEPARQVGDKTQRRQAKLFAGLSLVFAVLNTLGFLMSAVAGNAAGAFTLVGLSLALWLSYWLGRTRYFRVGIYLVLYGWTLGGIAYALSGQTARGPVFSLFSFLPIAFVFAASLLSARALYVYLGMMLVILVGLPVFSLALQSSEYVSLAGTLVSVAGLLLVNQWYRNALEKDRLQAISQAKNDAEMLQGFLEKQVLELHRAQDTLQKTQALLVSMVEHLPVGLMVVEQAEMRIANPAAAKILTGEDAKMSDALAVLRRHTWQVFHPDGSPCAPEELPLNKALVGNVSTYNEEMKIRREDGRERWILNNASPIFNARGEKVGAAVMFQDITERKQVEALVRENENKYRQLFEAESDAIFLVARETGLILDANSAAAALYGYSREELAGLSNRALCADGFVAGLADVQALAMLQAHFHRRRDGGIFPVEVTGREFDLDGRRVYLLAVRDVTERQEAETKIRQLNDELEHRVIERTAQLEQANRELEAFSYTVSHDLRAPLRAVNGYIRILLSEYGESLDEQAKTYLKRTAENAVQMGKLIDDLLAFARLGRHPVHRHEVHHAPLLRGMLAEMVERQPERNIKISVEEMPPLNADWSLFQQVYRNLFENAIKFTRYCEEASIKVGAIQQGDETVYFVRDNGAGFNMEYAGKLFGVFHRLHRQDEFEGTGVGLAIVHRIISRHGGRIWAEATPNLGAVFYFTLGA